MSPKKWVMAHKIKALTGAIIGVVGISTIGFNASTWAEDQRTEITIEISQKIKEERLIQKGRVQAASTVHAREMQKQAAKHDYDFYEIRAIQAEEQLVQLEEDVDSGVQLTSSQQRKMRRLEDQVKDFQKGQDAALERLAEAEENASE